MIDIAEEASTSKVEKKEETHTIGNRDEKNPTSERLENPGVIIDPGVGKKTNTPISADLLTHTRYQNSDAA